MRKFIFVLLTLLLVSPFSFAMKGYYLATTKP